MLKYIMFYRWCGNRCVTRRGRSKIKNKGKGVKQEQEEKIKVLEVEKEFFEKTMRSLVIEESKKKKDIKKKKKYFEKLKELNAKTMQMVDVMKDSQEEN